MNHIRRALTYWYTFGYPEINSPHYIRRLACDNLDMVRRCCMFCQLFLMVMCITRLALVGCEWINLWPFVIASVIVTIILVTNNRLDDTKNVLFHSYAQTAVFSVTLVVLAGFYDFIAAPGSIAVMTCMALLCVGSLFDSRPIDNLIAYAIGLAVLYAIALADSSNLKMAVQQGQVDVAYRSMTPTDIEDLSKDDKVKVVKGPGGEERFITFNFKIMPYGEKSSEPNADKAKAVRQAVANLIDRDELSTKVYKGTYTPLYSFIPDGLSGHDDTLKEAYGDGEGKPSTDKAKKVLEDAGVTTPVDLKLQYNPDHYGQSSADEYAAIKAQLEEGGLFKVDLQSTEWTQYSKDRVITSDSDGSYPAYQLGWFPDYSDPDNYLSPFFRDGNFVNNGYSNTEVNDLIVKQAGQTDDKEREDTLKEIQKLETDDLSTIPLLQGAQVAVTGSGVKGVVLDASFRFRYASVTKS